MMGEFLLYFIFLSLGIIIGMNLNLNQPSKDKDESSLPKEVKDLKSQIIVLNNVRDSLLEDVRYWRNKAKDGNQNH